MASRLFLKRKWGLAASFPNLRAGWISKIWYLAGSTINSQRVYWKTWRKASTIPLQSKAFVRATISATFRKTKLRSLALAANFGHQMHSTNFGRFGNWGGAWLERDSAWFRREPPLLCVNHLYYAWTTNCQKSLFFGTISVLFQLWIDIPHYYSHIHSRCGSGQVLDQMVLSKAAQAALDKAAQRAARVAEQDAGLRELDTSETSPAPGNETKDKKLAKAKELSRLRVVSETFDIYN